MRRNTILILIALAAILVAGCPQQQSAEKPPPPPDPEAPTLEESEPVQLTAYINVTSGCQEPTVNLLQSLGEKYSDSVDVEIVDFGSTEGNKRWREDGLQCMTLLFDGSPAVRIPTDGGQKQTVVFYFPAGFSWTHDDLKQTFAAIDEGTAEILSEEEAQKVLAPKPIEMTVEVREVEDGAEVVMNDTAVFTITQEADGSTPKQRAEAAKTAIEEWTSGNVHPTQLTVMNAGQGWSVLANGKELVRVYAVDAEAAGVEPVRKYAAQWMSGIKEAIVAAGRAE